MLRFILGSLLFFLGVLAPNTGFAARRAALLIDAAADGPTPVTELANVLKTGFGFDLIRFGQGELTDLDSAVSEFRRRIRGSEVSVVYFTGPLEHDATGTFLRSGAESDAKEVRIDDLLQALVNDRTPSIVVLEDRGSGTPSSGRHPGFGRMPVIDNLLIALATVPGDLGAGPATLAGTLATQFGRDEIHPDVLLSALRDSVYVRTAGRAVVRLMGTMPGSFTMERGPYRAGSINGIRSRAEDLCKSAAGAPPFGDAQLLSLVGEGAKGPRVASLEDLDSYTLAALYDEMQRTPLCPFARTPSLQDEAPPAKKTSPAKKDEPVAALPPPDKPAQKPDRDEAAPQTREEEKETPKEKDEQKAKEKEGTGVAAIPPKPEEPEAKKIVPPVKLEERDKSRETEKKRIIRKKVQRRVRAERKKKHRPSAPKVHKRARPRGPVNIPSF